MFGDQQQNSETNRPDPCPESEKETLNTEVIQGLLFISDVRGIHLNTEAPFNLIIDGFWTGEIISTEFSLNNIHLLKRFSVARNKEFLENVRNNHLQIKLYKKNEVTGIAKCPLHQFYIAFKDSEITSRLFKESLPVISVNDWIPVTNSIPSDNIEHLKVLLAMGTNDQLNYLEEKQGLSFPTSSQLFDSKSIENSDSQSKQKHTELTSNHLGNFIENLMQQKSLNSSTGKDNVKAIINHEKNPRQVQMRKTSDLLDTLNKAFATSPSENDVLSFYFDQLNDCPLQNLKSCKTSIEIERAVDLPRSTMKIGNKKISKRSPSGKRKQSRFCMEEEPSAYVTFHAAAGYGQMVKSHEGFVYATNVIERNCNPIWNKKFEVPFPIELFTNNEKCFILKVWRKVSTDLAQCRFQPLPMEDVVIGFSSINLNSLSTGNQISEWYNIIDHNGRIHGRLKIKIEPLENLDTIKQQVADLASKTTSKMTWSSNHADLSGTPLSRAIKRKFTELEEITERLKARLLGVTGELELDEDDFKDPVLEAQLEEFEHDLNTVCDEDEDDIENKNYDWSSVQQKTINSDNESKEKIETIETVVPSQSRNTIIPVEDSKTNVKDSLYSSKP